MPSEYGRTQYQQRLGTTAAVTFSGLLVMVTSGCATILSGTEQKVSVTTEPTGASVLVDGSGRFTSPVDLKLARKEEHTLIVSMPGYHTERVEVKKKLNAMVLGNVLVGGLIGASADVASGATYDLSPNRVSITLIPVRTGEVAAMREWSPTGGKTKSSGGSAASIPLQAPRNALGS